MVTPPSLQIPSVLPPSGLRVLSIREGARRMGISKSGYYDKIKRQPLPGQPNLPLPVKRGGRSGIAEHEIDAYIVALIHARDGKAGQ